jgi:hypothetical protein
MSLEEYLSGICWILLYRTVGTLQLVTLGQFGQGIPETEKKIKIKRRSTTQKTRIIYSN